VPPDSDTPVNPDPDAEPEAEKTFTQSQVNKIMAKEKREGRALGAREVMEQLGLDSLDDAKALIEETKDRESKVDDDAARRTKRLDERERKAEQKLKEATRKTNKLDVLAELVGEGMSKAKAQRAVSLVELDLEVEDLTPDEIRDAVVTLKDEMPELFGVVEKEPEEKVWRPVGSTPDSTARGGSPRKPQPASVADRAKAKFAERHPNLAKSTT
jgi:hypothetical protein